VRGYGKERVSTLLAVSGLHNGSLVDAAFHVRK
jgi:hypothetical protein